MDTKNIITERKIRDGEYELTAHYCDITLKAIATRKPSGVWLVETPGTLYVRNSLQEGKEGLAAQVIRYQQLEDEAKRENCP